MILRYLKKCFHYTFQTTLLEAPCLMWVCYYQSAEKYFLQMNYNILTALLVILGIIIDLYSLLALCHMQEFHNESEINKSFCSCCLSGFSFSGAFLEISCICRIFEQSLMEDIWRDTLLPSKHYIVMWKGSLNEWKKNYDLVHKGTIKKGHSGKIISST